jgi:putative spermidine/putrescine transport system substrate-binding protein
VNERSDTKLPREDLAPALSRREFVRLGAGALAGTLAAAPLAQFLAGPAEAAARAHGAGALAGHGPVPLALLEQGARREKALTTIALPPSWANYGAILSAFTRRYGIAIHNLAPDDSSGQEIQAVANDRTNTALEPDVVDVGPSFAVEGKAQGLFAPYKNANWDTIPAYLKDPDGYWVGDYYGVIAFGANMDVVRTMPKDWSDLLKPEYRGMVSIDGDPRSAQDAFMAVWAAALANGGSLDDIGPGIDFFAHLKKIGNFVPVDNLPANISRGTTPIAIKWDYLLLGYRDQFHGQPPLQVVVPATGVIGGYYCQAISRYAYHPYAARLWEEFLYSDEGQLLWLAGYAHPVRYQDLMRRGKIPASLARKLPPASAYAKAQFPTVAQSRKAAAVVAREWGPKVAGA